MFYNMFLKHTSYNILIICLLEKYLAFIHFFNYYSILNIY